MEFNLPKKKRIIIKDAPPDQRQIAVVPLRALTDKRLPNQAIKVLALLCSYANRAGITWVGKNTIAKLLGVTQPAISKQVGKLKAYGYIETVKKGYKGQRCETIRIIYNPSISTADAIANASGNEDLRSPQMKQEELQQMNETTKKPIKNKVVSKRTLTNNNQKVIDNKQEAMAVLASLKIERELNQADINAIYLAKDAELPIIDLIADLQNEYKMIRSEGLKEPESILGLTQRILMLRGL